MPRGGKKGASKNTLSVLPVDGTRTVVFTLTYTMNGERQTKDVPSRAELFAFLRGAQMFGLDMGTIYIERVIRQMVTVGKPGA